jgi:hypothetical protein
MGSEGAINNIATTITNRLKSHIVVAKKKPLSKILD